MKYQDRKSIVLQLGTSKQKIKSKLVYVPNEIHPKRSLLTIHPIYFHRMQTCSQRDTSDRHMCSGWLPAPLDVSDPFQFATSSTCYCLHPAAFTYLFPTLPIASSPGKTCSPSPESNVDLPKFFSMPFCVSMSLPMLQNLTGIFYNCASQALFFWHINPCPPRFTSFIMS